MFRRRRGRGFRSEFLKRLFTEMAVLFSRDDRQATDWLATGKAALGLFLADVQEATRQGLQIGIFKAPLYRDGRSLQPRRPAGDRLARDGKGGAGTFSRRCSGGDAAGASDRNF